MKPDIRAGKKVHASMLCCSVKNREGISSGFFILTIIFSDPSSWKFVRLKPIGKKTKLELSH